MKSAGGPCGACETKRLGFCNATEGNADLPGYLLAQRKACQRFVPAGTVKPLTTLERAAPEEFFRLTETRERLAITREEFVAVYSAMLYKFRDAGASTVERSKSFAAWFARFNDFAAFGE